jgi:hypothetical protein
MDALLIRSNVGLLPANDESREWFSKIRLGATVLAQVTQPRNPHFHRKFFALIKFAYDHWADVGEPVYFRDQPIQPDFERFRKDVTILAGKYHMVATLRGEVRAEADSISFARMSESDFQKLYSGVLDVLMRKVFKTADWTEDKVREIVDQLTEFGGD